MIYVISLAITGMDIDESQTKVALNEHYHKIDRMEGNKASYSSEI
jgi:hypothetical protein